MIESCVKKKNRGMTGIESWKCDRAQPSSLILLSASYCEFVQATSGGVMGTNSWTNVMGGFRFDILIYKKFSL